MAVGVSAIEQFTDRVRSQPRTWGAIDIRSVSFCQDGEWRSILANVRLLAGEPREYGPMDLEYEDDRFAVLQEVVGFSNFGELMDGLLQNRLKIRGRDARLDCPEVPPGPQPRPYFYNTQLIDRTWARQRHLVLSDFQTLVLEGSGQQVGGFVPQEDLDRAAAAVTAYEKPFNGLGDVARSLFYSAVGYSPTGWLASMTVAAPAYARIEEIVEVSGGTFDVAVTGPPSAQPAEFSINVIMRPLSDPPIRRALPLTEADVSSHVGYLRMTKRVEFAQAPLVELFLLRGGRPVDLSSFYLPVPGTQNPRVAAQLTYDAEGAKLRELLFPREKPKSDAFEIGISWLLFLCGFQTALHGLRGGKLNEEIDCIAFVPLSRYAVAVECTTADLNPTKLVRLASRCSALKDALADFEILPIAVTSLERVTTTETKTAAELGIAVLARPDIEELLRRAAQNPAASEIYQYFSSKVPSSLSPDPLRATF